MTFSASPLVPGAGTATDSEAWARAAALVVDAVTQAAAQIPSTEPLTAGQPVGDVSGLAGPDDRGEPAAVSRREERVGGAMDDQHAAIEVSQGAGSGVEAPDQDGGQSKTPRCG